MSARRFGRALFVTAIGCAAAVASPSGCLLAVPTDGLAGDPLPKDSASNADSSLEAAAAADSSDAGFDARDAFSPPAGAVTWSTNGHAYAIIIVPDGLSWFDAQTAAANMGGHLATLGSADENAFVLGLAQQTPNLFREDTQTGPWLGAYQASGASEPAGGWMWIDGTPWNYTDWQNGQPDNTNGTESYLDLYAPGDNIGWNDESVGGTAEPILSYAVEFE